MQVGETEIAILSLYLVSLPALNAAIGRCCQHGRRWTTAIVMQVLTLILLVIYCGYSTTKRNAR